MACYPIAPNDKPGMPGLPKPTRQSIPLPAVTMWSLMPHLANQLRKK